MKKVLKKCFPLLLAISAYSCSSPSEDEPTESETPVFTYRYFDRTLYFPQGVDITPEKSLAQSIIKDSLVQLQSSTDLGQDFFTTETAESSLLQPVLEEKRRDGVSWMSFIQVFEDNEFDDLVATTLGNVTDEDIVVARNSKNQQEYFIVLRLSCFVAGETCSFASQTQAKIMLFRAYGYLIGMRFGENANTPIMKPGVSADQNSEAATKQYYADFNAQLEKIRYDAVSPR